MKYQNGKRQRKIDTLCHLELVSGSLFMNNSYFVYIVSNKIRTTLYIGVTNNLQRRIYEHKQGLIEGFTKKYKVKDLIYFEEYQQVDDAIRREKQLKNWHREWKLNLIKKNNPQQIELSLSRDAETSSA